MILTLQKLQGTIGAALLAQGTPYVKQIAKRYPHVTIAANGAAIALFLGWAILKHSHRALKFVRVPPPPQLSSFRHLRLIDFRREWIGAWPLSKYPKKTFP